MVPSITTTKISISARGNKLYIDPNQNDYADTVAAPYSVRPFHMPTVSTPLDWKEVKPGLKAEDFVMQNILNRIKKKGDLFKGVDDQKLKSKNSDSLRNYLIS
jgi:bifunctional non-homologous end joining protein LigD